VDGNQGGRRKPGWVRDARVAIGCLIVLAAMPGCRDDAAGPEPAAPEDTTASPGLVTVALGTAERVMQYRLESCEEYDLPDVQARAFRRADGTLVLVSGNAPLNYWMAGSGFDDLTRVCQPVLESGDDPEADTFDNQEWITSVYREGGVVHALVHNEYHDPFAPNCRPGDTSPANPCWYNAVTYARSTDGGRTFAQLPAPAHVVAAPPARWDPVVVRGAPGPYGYFSPSNIVRGPDGAHYAVLFGIPHRDRQGERGACVMRSANLSDPSGWQAWDGGAYSIRMPSPYVSDGTPACAFVSQAEIQDLHGSLTYNDYLKRWILVGSSIASASGAVACGDYFSLSRDLIHWTPKQLLRPVKLPNAACGAGPEGSEIYPSLIDHADTTVNYERTGRRPHLYYVRWNQGLNRDLWRVPLTFDLR